MLEHPRIRRYSSTLIVDSDKPTGADNQQERPRDNADARNPQRPYARLRKAIPKMIWPDLHGDMQSQAETTWPPSQQLDWAVTNMNGPKVAKFLVG
jgi:hypothetical protein